ncbi:MAG: hypothetical protein HY805_00515 [Nitrospirae bacterium]|nr:hypothetical protein [Nitrospirota bacterium]
MKLKLLLLLSAVVFLASCASAPPPIDLSGYVWPKPPDEPKIKLIKFLITDVDVRELSTVEKIFGSDPTFRFEKPHAITVDKDGNIYVTDTRRNQVVIMNPDKKTFTTLGNPYSWRSPLGVAVDNTNNLIAVADGASGQVFVFDRIRRSFEYAIGQKGEFRNPVGVAFDSDRQILYIADSKKHEISAYSLNGQFIKRVAESGVAAGQVYYPSQMVTDAQGLLYVVDTMNFRIQILDPMGDQPPKVIGEHGNAPGMFARPKGIAVSPDGYIFVTDAAFGNFQIFDNQGKNYLFVGITGPGPGMFDVPQGIYVDDNDKIYVADQLNRRVQIFQYMSERYKAEAGIQK